VGSIHQCIEDPVCQAIETFMCFGPAVFRLDHIEDRLLERILQSCISAAENMGN
jgi:hypothetical protein